MATTYYFKLQVSSISNGAHFPVTPRYTDSATRNFELETGEVFHRERWDINAQVSKGRF
jgi:hypothetical protein